MILNKRNEPIEIILCNLLTVLVQDLQREVEVVQVRISKQAITEAIEFKRAKQGRGENSLFVETLQDLIDTLSLWRLP